MKYIFLIFLLSVSTFSPVFAQKTSSQVEQMVQKGVQQYDQGQYIEALSTFNKVLEIEQDNLPALTEKALTLYALRRYEEAIIYCKKAIHKYPKNENLKAVYTTYGSALDALEKREAAVAVYNEALQIFPHFYLLYFNKGVTLWRNSQLDSALRAFQKSAVYNPRYENSHLAMAAILHQQGEDVPAFFAVSRFLYLHPQDQKGQQALKLLGEIIAGTSEAAKHSHDVFEELAGDAPQNEDQYGFASLAPILHRKPKPGKNPETVDFIIGKFNKISDAITEMKNSPSNFYWDYYVPYYLELKAKGFLPAFVHKLFSEQKQKNIQQWLNQHDLQAIRLYSWDSSYDWQPEKHLD